MSAGSVVLNEKNQNQWLTEVEVSELTKLSVSTLRAHRFYRKGMPQWLGDWQKPPPTTLNPPLVVWHILSARDGLFCFGHVCIGLFCYWLFESGCAVCSSRHTSHWVATSTSR